MKATGIVRRIDDLGRVVIPKEIRRTMRIHEGDSLEIFTDRNGEVIFKKYSLIGELASTAKACAAALTASTGLTAVVSDKDYIIAAGAKTKKDISDKRISAQLEHLIDMKNVYNINNKSPMEMPLVNNSDEFLAAYSTVITSNGDPVGSISYLYDDKNEAVDEEKVNMINLCAAFLSASSED